jgi:hypothetical protein
MKSPDPHETVAIAAKLLNWSNADSRQPRADLS